MRIAGYIGHPEMKITIFEVEHRFIVKFETEGLEQAYKFRKGAGIQKVADVQKLVGPAFQKAVGGEMARMARIQKEALQRLSPDEEEDEFEEII